MNFSTAESPSVAQPWRFTLRGLFIVITLLAVLFGVVHALVRAVNAARQAAVQSTIQGTFKQVVLALHEHDFIHHSLPYAAHLDTGEPDQRPSPQLRVETGQPLYSWRYSCCMFMDILDRTPKFNHAWDSPELARERVYVIYPYCGEHSGPDRYNTRIFAITGPGTAWGDGTTPPLSLNDIAGDTILIVEVRNSGTHWMQPGDFDIRTMPRTINAPDGKGISGRYSNGFTIGLADGSVPFVHSNVPFEALEKFFTVEGAKQYDLDEELAPYLNN